MCQGVSRVVRLPCLFLYPINVGHLICFRIRDSGEFGWGTLGNCVGKSTFSGLQNGTRKDDVRGLRSGRRDGGGSPEQWGWGRVGVGTRRLTGVSESTSRLSSTRDKKWIRSNRDTDRLKEDGGSYMFREMFRWEPGLSQGMSRYIHKTRDRCEIWPRTPRLPGSCTREPRSCKQRRKHDVKVPIWTLRTSQGKKV